MHTLPDDVRPVRIEPNGIEGLLGMCDMPRGLLIFAHGSGSGRFSPRNNYVAAGLRREGFSTLLPDLLLPGEDGVRSKVFDIPMLASRLLEVMQWAQRQPETKHFGVGLFGASTGAGAALVAAAHPDTEVRAVVSRGGRPDLAGASLSQVRSPTLLIVGGLDTSVIALNRQALAQLSGRKELIIVPGASHLFEETGTLDEVLRLAAAWFADNFPAKNLEHR